VTRSLRTTIGLMALLGCARAASAPPAPPSATPRPADERASAPVVPRRDIAKLAMGDGVIAVYARGDGRVEVGASAPGGSLVLMLAPVDIEQWAKTTTAILQHPARARRGTGAVERTTLAEPGVTAGALTFSRERTRRSVTYGLFFADRQYGGFPIHITRHDVGVLVSTLRKAAASARALQRRATSDTIAAPRDTTRRHPPAPQTRAGDR